MTFGERRPLVEDDLWWKTTFGGRRSLVEDDLRRKMTFCGRRPTEEDNLRWKTTFSGRQLLVEGDFRRILHAAFSSLRHFFFILWATLRIGTEFCTAQSRQETWL